MDTIVKSGAWNLQPTNKHGENTTISSDTACDWGCHQVNILTKAHFWVRHGRSQHCAMLFKKEKISTKGRRSQRFRTDTTVALGFRGLHNGLLWSGICQGGSRAHWWASRSACCCVYLQEHHCHSPACLIPHSHQPFLLTQTHSLSTINLGPWFWNTHSITVSSKQTFILAQNI